MRVAAGRNAVVNAEKDLVGLDANTRLPGRKFGYIQMNEPEWIQDPFMSKP